MLHDIIILAVLAAAALLSVVCYHHIMRTEFSKTRISNAEWWHAEGMMIFFAAFVALLLLAVVGHFFNALN